MARASPTRSNGAGPAQATARRGRVSVKWHLDEVFIRIRGKRHYLWRALDQHGTGLDVLVERRRNTKAACAKRMRSIKRFFKKLLKGPFPASS